jgi:hypothetical protein
MDPAAIAERVDELAHEHSGPAFAEAIQEYSVTLDEASREELKRIVLERAANFDQAVMERVEAHGWLRRQWDEATGSSPRGNRPHR